MEKTFNIRQNIGKAKFVVSFNDGKKTYKDGSKFYDIAIFKNKKALNKFIEELINKGYKEL